jgi:hypothetical protein
MLTILRLALGVPSATVVSPNCTGQVTPVKQLKLAVLKSLDIPKAIRGVVPIGAPCP